MPPLIRAVTKGKRILLFKEMLADFGHPDVSLWQCMASGFPLLGPMPETGVFEAAEGPEAVRREDILKTCPAARERLVNARPADDAAVATK
eukprot:4726887-Alexandrium_andersonii.AAC.1